MISVPSGSVLEWAVQMGPAHSSCIKIMCAVEVWRRVWVAAFRRCMFTDMILMGCLGMGHDMLEHGHHSLWRKFRDSIVRQGGEIKSFPVRWHGGMVVIIIRWL